MMKDTAYFVNYDSVQTPKTHYTTMGKALNAQCIKMYQTYE